MSALRLPVVRFLQSVFLGPGQDRRSPPNCLDLARLRIVAARARQMRLSPARMHALLSEEVQGVAFVGVEDDVLTVRTADETSEYHYQVTLPPLE